MNGMLLDFLIRKYGLAMFFVIDLSGDGKPDGYLFAGKESNEIIQIISIAIYKQFEGKGWGKKLLQYLFTQSKEANSSKIELHVEHTNYKAISLYEKFGFKQIEIAPNYYGELRDAFIMFADI